MKNRLVSICIAALVGVAGCGPSRGELASVKDELATVTAARDALNAELAESQERAGRLEQRVLELESKLAAAPRPPAGPAATGAKGAKAAPRKAASRRKLRSS